MKILFVSAVLPYPIHSGGQIRMYNLLKRLSQKHEIHLFSFIRTEQEKEYLGKLRFCKSVTTVLRGRAWQPKYVWKTLTSSYPLLWSSYHNARMQSILADEITTGKYDLIHIEPGYVWPSLPSGHRIPIIVCEHNIEHAIYEGYVRSFPISPLKPFLSLDVAKMIRWEKRIWKEARHIVTVSESDKSYIAQSNVSVVPNGVDCKAFTFKPKKVISKSPVFLYVGNFRWMENKDAAENIQNNYWPVIKKQYPDASLRIVGQYAPDGPIKSIQEELAHADILLAPIRIGGGTKFKILEAMAAGVPVITTTIGAMGMNKDVLWIADTPEQLDIRSVLSDRTKVKKARNLIEKEYNWDTIAIALDHIWNSQS